MKRRWIVIIFTICFGMGMLLPVHAQEKDKIWAGTNSKIEKIEEALYKDFDDVDNLLEELKRLLIDKK